MGLIYGISISLFQPVDFSSRSLCPFVCLCSSACEPCPISSSWPRTLPLLPTEFTQMTLFWIGIGSSLTSFSRGHVTWSSSPWEWSTLYLRIPSGSIHPSSPFMTRCHDNCTRFTEALGLMTPWPHDLWTMIYDLHWRLLMLWNCDSLL